MTDFGPWTRFIRKLGDEELAKAAAEEHDNGGYVTLGRSYYQVPLDDYQIVNLFGTLLRAPQANIGDFYWELLSVLGEVIIRMEIDQTNNYGDRVNKELVHSVYQGEWDEWNTKQG